MSSKDDIEQSKVTHVEIDQDKLNKLNWAEAAGLENLRCHLKSIDDLAKESQITLTIVLAGIGLAFKYIMDDMNTHAPGISCLGFGLMMFMFYLVGVGALLTFKCLKIGGAPPPTNEPLNLYDEEYTLSELKHQEIVGINNRIKKARDRNSRTARWLNRARAALTASPLVFLFFYLMASLIRRTC